MFNCFAAFTIIYKAALTLLKVATESAHSSALTAHVSIHTWKKPYICKE